MIGGLVHAINEFLESDYEFHLHENQIKHLIYKNDYSLYDCYNQQCVFTARRANQQYRQLPKNVKSELISDPYNRDRIVKNVHEYDPSYLYQDVELLKGMGVK